LRKEGAKKRKKKPEGRKKNWPRRPARGLERNLRRQTQGGLGTNLKKIWREARGGSAREKPGR